jgi:hypothetical protein
MHRNAIGRVILVALACLVLFPLAAAAQSSIVGLVRDESGGVLPGVTVEAASPVLIEKVRTSVTDEQGRYRIIDLRPGVYSVTFGLPGFSTLVRDGVEVASNVTVTINGDLKVGALQETVTVSGETPVVDVQQVSRTQVVTRDFIDALPTSRNLMSLGSLVPGLRASTPDVGGSRSMEQPYMRGHGLGSVHTTQMAEGMQIQSQEGTEGSSMTYYDDALVSETSVMTAAIPADTSSGGIRINSILKDGGNVVSGAVFLGGTNGTWQTDNVDDNLRTRGFKSANGTAHVQNFNGMLSGPLVQDKLWFVISARHTSQDEIVANVPTEIVLPDGTIIRSVMDQFVRNGSLKLTWQVSPRNKFSAWLSRIFKRKGKDFGFGADPRFAAQRDTRHGMHYAAGQLRWSTTLSSKFLFEGGYSTSYQHFSSSTQPGTYKTAFTPEWYAHASKSDSALNTMGYYQTCAFVTGCTSWDGGQLNRTEATRRVIAGSVSYVTGSHNVKVGFADSFGPYDNYNQRNGDINLNYVNGVPSTVTVYNTPYIRNTAVKYDLGIYLQDTWTIKRLTFNPGVRIQWFNSWARPSSVVAGRFAPARFFAAQENMPDWGPDYAPRFSAAYDLFGDGKTALKASVSKYYYPRTNGIVSRYANSTSSSDSRTWFDADLIPGTSTRSGIALATNGDGIAQDNEIGPTSSTTFGLRSDRNPVDGLKRTSNWEYTTSVQQQLMTGMSVSAAYFHRTWRDLEVTDRTLITTADYTSFTTPMPSFSNDPTLTGVLNPNEILTIYNLNAAKRSSYSAAQVDYNSAGTFNPTGDPDQAWYNGVEISFTWRVRNTQIFGGYTIERNVSRTCDNNDNPNGISGSDLYEGNTTSLGGRFCDQSKFNVPFVKEFKVSGNYPLPFGIDFGAVLQAYPGANRTVTWQPAASLFPGGRTNSETIILNEPGSLYQPRYTQLDVNFRKNFRHGRKRFTLQVDFFNALNGNAIWTTNNAIGSSLGQVQTILQGRLPRLAFQMQF